MKRKLGIISECIGNDTVKNLPLIKTAGFDSFFTGYYRREDVAKIAEKAAKVGLEFDFIHAPFAGINSMWLEGEEGDAMLEKLIESVRSAHEYGARSVITHVSSGWNPPIINEIGVARYDKLLDFAQKNGVILSFENLRRLGHLAFLMERYEGNEYAKLCYDFGHANCYCYMPVPFAKIYGNRIECTHIHDNLGISHIHEEKTDLHLMPFDGNIDYASIIRDLDDCGYDRHLTIETDKKSAKMTNISDEQFLANAYERACKLNSLSKK